MPTVIWIMIGVIVLAACFGNKKGAGMRDSGGQKKTIRIDHPHYFDLDEYECSVCGARFRKQSMVCPRCGARFDGIKEDETEFEEELLEEEEWDEEEGL